MLFINRPAKLLVYMYSFTFLRFTPDIAPLLDRQILPEARYVKVTTNSYSIDNPRASVSFY